MNNVDLIELIDDQRTLVNPQESKRRHMMDIPGIETKKFLPKKNEKDHRWSRQGTLRIAENMQGTTRRGRKPLEMTGFCDITLVEEVLNKSSPLIPKHEEQKAVRTCCSVPTPTSLIGRYGALIHESYESETQNFFGHTPEGKKTK